MGKYKASTIWDGCTPSRLLSAETHCSTARFTREIARARAIVQESVRRGVDAPFGGKLLRRGRDFAEGTWIYVINGTVLAVWRLIGTIWGRVFVYSARNDWFESVFASLLPLFLAILAATLDTIGPIENLQNRQPILKSIFNIFATSEVEKGWNDGWRGVRVYFSSFMNQRKGRRGERNTLETRNLVKPFLKIHRSSLAPSTPHTYTHTHMHTFLTLSLTGQVFTFSIHQRQKARRNRGRGGRGREKKRGIPGKRVKDGIGEK